MLAKERTRSNVNTPAPPNVNTPAPPVGAQLSKLITQKMQKMQEQITSVMERITKLEENQSKLEENQSSKCPNCHKGSANETKGKAFYLNSEKNPYAEYPIYVSIAESGPGPYSGSYFKVHVQTVHFLDQLIKQSKGKEELMEGSVDDDNLNRGIEVVFKPGFEDQLEEMRELIPNPDSKRFDFHPLVLIDVLEYIAALKDFNKNKDKL